MNVLIPCAGRGSRFVDAGYTLPKPLIDVTGQPMIERVLRNLSCHMATHILLTQAEHWHTYKKQLFDAARRFDTTFLLVDKVTEGAACTTLLAESFINTDEPLLIANSDQLVLDWDFSAFSVYINRVGPDGCIVTFPATDPKWSFAKVDSSGQVTEVAEKRPISDIATVGIYYWAKGSDYVKYAKQMIAKNIRTNGEFFVCPTYNEAIADGQYIVTYPVQQMWGIGTPDDLINYLNHVL